MKQARFRPLNRPFRWLAIYKLFFLSVVACLHVSANHAYAQNTVTLSETNATLVKVFRQIKRQTGYSYFFTDEIAGKANKVSIQVKNAPLMSVLDQIFREQPLTYSVVGKTIVIKAKHKTAEVKKTLTENSSLIDVKGRVVNESGDALEGISVTIKGTKRVTITDANGEFSFKGVEDAAVLVLTSVNMERVEIEVGGKKDLVINLKTKFSSLGQVEVTLNTGYQNLPRERATGSFSQTNKEMYNARVATDVISKLEGITSGLVFYKNGTLNRNELRIRGQSTIFANAQPLIVVDNFPYEGDIANINPNDVEDVVVLKDAAAASIWGVRAGNGVIVITTKKGKFNQPLKIQFNTNVTVGDKPDLTYDPNFLPSDQFIDLERTLFGRGYYDADLNNTTTRQPVSPVVEILARQRAGQITQAEADAQINALRNLDVRDQLSKYFYQRSVFQQYAINLSGGSPKASYFFSAGYDKNRANLVNNQYERITLNSLNKFMPVAKLEVSAGINYVQNVSQVDATVARVVTGGSPRNYDIYPYAQFRDAAGNDLPIVKDYRQSFAQSAPSRGFLDWQFYPLRELGQTDNKRRTTDLRLVGGLKYTIMKGFSAELLYQNERQVFQAEEYNPLGSYVTNNTINRFASVAANGTVIKDNNNIRPFNVPLGGILNSGNTQISAQSARAQLHFSNTWQKHSVIALAGFEAREVATNGSSYMLYGYDKNFTTYKVVNFDSTFRTYPTGTSRIPTGVDLESRLNRFRSFYANAAYTFDSKYTLSVSARTDGSNYFGVRTNQKYTPLWSVGGKWDIDRETFYNISWLPVLRFRTTYGYNGNLDSRLSAVTTFSYASSPASLTNATVANLVNVPNPELRWERVGIFNAGLDFELAKKVVSGSIEYFTKKGIDLIGDAPFAPSTGISQLRGNFTSMKGSGFDVQLAVKNINRAIKWTTTLLISYATDKVTKYDINSRGVNYLANEGYGGAVYPVVGRPVYGVYSYRWGGLDPGTGDPRGYVADTLSRNYTLLTNPSNASDVLYNGPARPVYYGGLYNMFSYKGFSLSVNISYKFKYYIRRGSLNYATLFNSWRGHSDYNDRWQKPGDESLTNVPSMPASVVTARENFYLNSEVLVERGDHIRFQDVSLRYDFNKAALGKLPYNNLQLYFYANNLGVIWRANDLNIDPDYPTGGVPAPRTFAFGIRADF